MSSSFIDLQLQAIDQCHRENKINDSEKAFLEEKWKEAQGKGDKTEDDIFQSFDKMIGMKFGPGVGRIRQELQTMKSQLLVAAEPLSAQKAPAVPKAQNILTPASSQPVQSHQVQHLQTMISKPLQYGQPEMHGQSSLYQQEPQQPIAMMAQLQSMGTSLSIPQQMMMQQHSTISTNQQMYQQRPNVSGVPPLQQQQQVSQSMYPPPQQHVQLTQQQIDQKMFEIENHFPSFTKIVDALKNKGVFTQTDADRILQLKKESIDHQTTWSPEQRSEHFNKQLGQVFGPRTKQIQEMLSKCLKQWCLVRFGEKKNPIVAPSIQVNPIPSSSGEFDKQYPDQVPILSVTINPSGLGPPLPAKEKKKKASKSSAATSADDIERNKPITQVNGAVLPGSVNSVDILSELSKINTEADESMRIVDKTVVVISDLTEGDPDAELRNAMRSTLTSTIDMDIETDMDLETSLSENVANSDLMANICRRARRNYADFEITQQAKRLLSEGVQTHLKNVVEATFRLAQGRLNRQPFQDHALLLHKMAQCAAIKGDFVGILSKTAALQWGPDVSEILAREEAAAEEYVRKYNEIDEQQLLKKMIHIEDETIKQSGVGVKRNAGAAFLDQEAWHYREAAADRHGLLSWHEMGQVIVRSKIAKDNNLGHYKKRIMTKAEKEEAGKTKDSNTLKEATLPGSGADLQTVDTNAFILSSLQYSPKPLSEHSNFENQNAFHEKTLTGNQLIRVSKNDLYTAISKTHSLGSSSRSKQFLTYWKVT